MKEVGKRYVVGIVVLKCCDDLWFCPLFGNCESVKSLCQSDFDVEILHCLNFGVYIFFYRVFSLFFNFYSLSTLSNPGPIPCI